MCKNISREYIRKQKVDRVKEKILSEIEEIHKKTITNIVFLSFEREEESIEFYSLIKREFSLYQLREYIKKESTFMRYHQSNEKNIVYIVSDTTLDIWLQEDYNFSLKLLLTIEKEDIDISMCLDDNFFEHEFISVFERTLYGQK